MSTQTLAELANFVHDDLTKGVAQDIITVNPIFGYVPFTGYRGNGVSVNREQALGDSGLYSVGDTITHRTPSTSAKVTFVSTKLIGQTDMDNLVQVEGESDGVDMLAQELSSKSKSISRLFQTQMVGGSGVLPNMNSFHSLIDSSQYTAASAGQALSFALLDQLLALVLAKDGQVDFIMWHRNAEIQFKALYRALGGAQPQTTIWTNPFNGEQRTILTYEGIPCFRNDYLSITETANGAALTGGDKMSVWAGVWDDGSRKVGLSAIYPEASQAGIQIKQVGTAETKDEEIWRLVWYTNLANFNRRGLARLPSITTAI